MKNDTDDGVESLADREAAPDKISVFFQHSVGRPEASVKSSRSNDTPTGWTRKVENGITIRLSLLDEYH